MIFFISPSTADNPIFMKLIVLSFSWHCAIESSGCSVALDCIITSEPGAVCVPGAFNAPDLPWTLPWASLLAAAAAAAAAYPNAEEDDSTNDSQGNDQGFKVNWITQKDKVIFIILYKKRIRAIYSIYTLIMWQWCHLLTAGQHYTPLWWSLHFHFQWKHNQDIKDIWIRWDFVSWPETAAAQLFITFSWLHMKSVIKQVNTVRQMKII